MIKKLGGEDCWRSRSLSALLEGSGVLQLFPIFSNLLSPLDPSSTPHIVVRLTLSSSSRPSMVRMTAVVITIVSLLTLWLHFFYFLAYMSHYSSCVGIVAIVASSAVPK